MHISKKIQKNPLIFVYADMETGPVSSIQLSVVSLRGAPTSSGLNCWIMHGHLLKQFRKNACRE